MNQPVHEEVCFSFVYCLHFSEAFTGAASKMASRKRPHDSTKPDTPTNGLNSSLEEINIQNGSNSSFDDHSNGYTPMSRYAVKNASPSRPVSFISSGKTNKCRTETFNEMRRVFSYHEDYKLAVILSNRRWQWNKSILNNSTFKWNESGFSLVFVEIFDKKRNDPVFSITKKLNSHRADCSWPWLL